MSSSSSSQTPFTRSHHTTRRFNNVARLKMANHHPMVSANFTSLDINNNNSSNPGAVFAHYEHGHADSILEALNDLRISRHLCDVTIIVDQHEYACHKVRGESQSSNIRLNMFRMSSLHLVHTFEQCSLHLKCVNLLNQLSQSMVSILMPCPN